MKTYYIIINHPPYPNKDGRTISVTKRFPKRDSLSPDLVGIWTVQAYSRADAIANAIIGRSQRVIGDHNGVFV